MKLTRLLFAVLIGTLFAGCENEIDINAPWQETPVIYGFLDVNKTTQYIRVQKTYQNSVDLTTAEGAQISDSLYFKDSTATITVTPSGGAPVTFTKVDTLPKNSGFFASDVNFIYQANMVIDPSREYNLQVYSKATGKSYTSKTRIVGVTSMDKSGTTIFIRPYRNTNPIQFKFTLPSGAYIYDAAIRFWYREYPTGNPGAFKLKYVDFFYRKNFLISTPETLLPHSSELIYHLKNVIEPASNVTREFQQIDYVVTSGSKEIKDIIDLSKPSAVIVQRKTDFSNINGGLGIFSSRSETVKSNIPLQDDSSKVYLVKDLPNFIY